MLFVATGLYIDSTSNGFVVDVTPPTFRSHLSLSTLGSIVEGTSVLRSVLHVEWDVADRESYIETQYLSILAHTGGDFNSSAVKVNHSHIVYLLLALTGSDFNSSLISQWNHI